MSGNRLNETNTVIHLAIAFDNNYLNPFYALAASLISAHPGHQLHIHAIATGLEHEEYERISRYLSASGHVITFYKIDESVARSFVLLDKWTSAVYYRLFFPFLVPSAITRLLYLDSDMIVLKNLSEIYAIDLEGRPVAAVYDNYVKIQPLLNITEEGEYFNSGMLLIDVAQWREVRVSERAMEFLRDHPERIRFVDQCALNAVLYHNWKKVDARYNLLYSYIPEGMSRKQMEKFLENKVIVHFTLQRPWQMLCKNPLRGLYFSFLRKAGRTKSYSDFSVSKLPAWLRIRAVEFYFNLPFLQRMWRYVKS